MKLVTYHDVKLAHVNVDQMRELATIDSIGIVINADANAKNLLTKLDVMMGLHGTYVHVNVNVRNRMMLVNTWIMLIVNIAKD